jgi:hypothetical protein
LSRLFLIGQPLVFIAAGGQIVPVGVGDVDRLGRAFVEVGLPRQRHVFGQIARL